MPSLRKLFSGLLLASLLGPGLLAQAQKVGIGITTPSQALDVNGQVRVRSLQGEAAGRLLGLAADGTLQAQAPAFGAPVPAAFAQPTGQAAVATAGSPQHVVVNPAGTRAFVLSPNRGQLETFELGAGLPRSLSIVQPMFDAQDLAINAAGTRLYVVAGIIGVYDISSGLPVYLGGATASQHPGNVALDPAGPRAFVLTERFVLVVFSLNANGTLINTPSGTAFTTKSNLQNLAVHPTGTRVYVLNTSGLTSSELLTYDVSGVGDPVLLGSVPVSGQPLDLVLNAAGTRAYVVSAGSNTLQVFNLSNSSSPVSLGTVPTGNSPSALALSATGTQLYVTNAADNTLQVYEVSGPGLPVSLAVKPTGSSPQAVAAPTGARLYVANGADNTLQIFEQQNQPRVLAVGAAGGAGSLGAAQLPGAGRLPAAYGSVGSGGTVFNAVGGFTVQHSATGVYRLSFTGNPLSTIDLGQAATVATLFGAGPGSISYRTGQGYVEVLTYAPGGAAADRGFTFSVALP